MKILYGGGPNVSGSTLRQRKTTDDRGGADAGSRAVSGGGTRKRCTGSKHEVITRTKGRIGGGIEPDLGGGPAPTLKKVPRKSEIRRRRGNKIAKASRDEASWLILVN